MIRQDGPGGDRRAVAVTGVGVVTPVGTGRDAFWSSLVEGRSGIGPITRWDASGHRARIAGEVSGFDAAEWLNVKQRRRLDPFCHYALAAAQMAVSDAAFDPVDPGRVGTVFASGFGGIGTMDQGAEDFRRGGPDAVSPMLVPGSIPNIAAGQVALEFGYGGPSVCPVTACASSADAVGWGYRLVRDGYADACLVGGAEACLEARVMAGFARIRALSFNNDAPQAASRPFDAGRDGFVLAEGGAALLLEPLAAARVRGARVYAEVCGYGQTCDAYNPTAPDPTGAAAARALLLALDEAGAEPDDVDYVNAHGTSTPMLDAAETRAIRLAFGAAADRMAVSSTKSMTGHLLGAAGATEAVACALAVHSGVLPPTINQDTPDPACDLDYVPNRSRAAAVRLALSNSMGFGGHNVCLALRRPEGAIA